MRKLAWLALAAGIVIAAGCASGSRNNVPRPETVVIVDNQAVLDMNIFVLRGGQRVRLGMATGLSKSRFVIPQGMVFGASSLRFLADPIGSQRTPITEEIVVSEGDEVTLRIPPGAG